MIQHQRAEGDTLRGMSSARSWAVWTLPRSAQAFLLVTEAGFVGATAILLARETLSSQAVVRLTVISALAIGYAEVSRRSGRMQRYLGANKIITTPKSVWSYAAVLTLPLGWAAFFIVIQFGHQHWQRRRDASGATYRMLFTAASIGWAQLAAGAVFGAGQRAGGTHVLENAAALAAMPVFVVVNVAVLVCGIWLSARPPSIRPLLGDAESISFEIGTLVLGLATAEFLIHSPVLTPVVLILVALLHRSTVVKALQKFATTDDKTGLLTAAAWRETALATLQRAARGGAGAAVLMVDLDHFKLVNDRHGHLAGDRVLAGVAACLRRELRGYDGVGRFGGEELVAVLEGVSQAETVVIADRVRASIAALRLEGCPAVTASIGLAHAGAGREVTLDVLLERADQALYEAKDAGRDRVRAAA